jgi:putative ABC transport system permease protein
MRFPEQAARRMISWGESVRFALGAITADKLKTSLSTLGVGIGSAAIVLVVTIASTGKAYIVRQIEGIGANLAYATLDRNVAPPVLADELTPEDLTAVRQVVPSVHAIAGTYDNPVDFQLGGKLIHARLVGVTRDFEKIRNLRITSGRYFDADDFLAHFKVCLITEKVAQTGFGFDPAVGKTLRVNEFRCTIIGTFKEGVPTFGLSEIQDATLLIPFPLVKQITGDNFFQVLYAQAASSGEVPAMTQEMGQLLRSRHRREARYSVANLSALLQTAARISLAITAVLLAIAVVTLTVAGTGIMNIMLADVSQRTHEIGIRKAIGASPVEIRRQFLLEALFISFSGAVAGVVSALGIIFTSARWVEQIVPLRISWIGVMVALLVPSAIGVLFGYRPAGKAANLNPIDALRTE